MRRANKVQVLVADFQKALLRSKAAYKRLGMCSTDAERALGDSLAPLGHSVGELENLSGPIGKTCWCLRKLKITLSKVSI